MAEPRESHRLIFMKSHGESQVSVGNVVVVHDESLPRGFWKLGCIQNVMMGRDGKTRGSTVKVAGQESTIHFLELTPAVVLNIRDPPSP